MIQVCAFMIVESYYYPRAAIAAGFSDEATGLHGKALFLFPIEFDKMATTEEGKTMSAFDSSQSHILIWQPPLPPETTILVPEDPAGVQVDLRPTHMASEPPPDWLRENLLVDQPDSVPLEPSRLPDAPEAQPHKIVEGDRPEGVHPTVKLLASLVATNAILQDLQVSRKPEEPQRPRPKKDEEDEG
jgi:hypothetical protein